MVIYVVKQGDSIYSIAQRYGVTEQEIIEANGLSNTQRLMIGQAIVVPTDNVVHTVGPGESLFTIARNYNTTVSEILEANPNITDSSRIFVGQEITIPTAAQNLGTISVNGYAYPNINLNTLDRTLPYLTFISIFSYQVRPDGSLITIPDETIIQRARAAGVAPLMVITNIEEGGSFSSDLAHTILTNEQVQNTLIESVITTLGKGYTGLDIDFEYVYPYDRVSYNNFLRKVSERLRPLGYSISTALAPKTSGDQPGLLYEAHDYPVHGEVADHVILMTYEWGYTYGPAQAVAPLDQVERVITYAVTVIPPEKILMGMPNYGYNWTLPFVQGSAAQSLSNVGAVELAQRVGVQIQYDNTAQAPFFTYYDSNRKQHIVWFEDARSVQAKLLLANRFNLDGVSIWTITSFFPQLWSVMDSMFTIRKIL